MLELLENTKNSPLFDTADLEEFAKEPFPRNGLELLDFEERTLSASHRLADAIIAAQIERAHSDEEFVAAAIAAARARCSGRLRHKGTRTVSILLAGGTRASVMTPYLRQEHRGRAARRRAQQQEGGARCYPVLEALGIHDRVSPASRSEIALHVVQSASYLEAARMLARRGMALDVSTLVRVTTTTAERSLALRNAALVAALRVPLPEQGPLAGKRVRVGLDGGRLRTREVKAGRRTARGRHRYNTPWREPRVLTIDILDAAGKADRLCLPLYDATLGDADTTWALVAGYLRLLGAARADVVEFIADGAAWIWERVGLLVEVAGIAPERVVEVVDFYHASDHLSSAVELIKTLSASERRRLFERLRHDLRHEERGVEKVIERLLSYAVTRRGKALKKALTYFETHRERMRYHALDTRHLPVGSGQVESAVRRVVNLRFKAPGTFWTEAHVSGLLHLRAAFKAGRWDEILSGVLRGTFLVPSFEQRPSAQVASQDVVSPDSVTEPRTKTRRKVA